MIRLLFFSANPQTAPSLDLKGEYRALEDRLRADGRLACADPRHISSGTFDLLEREIRAFRPNVIHFAGHGQPTGSILESAQRQGVLMPPDALGRLLELLRTDLRCLVLNACHSVAQANALLPQVPCVVGMQDAVSDPSAVRFSTSFYAALAAGDSVGTSFELARNSLYGTSRPDPELPALVARPGAKELPLVKKVTIFGLHADTDQDAFDSLRRSMAVYRRAGVLELCGGGDAPATGSGDRYSEDQLEAADLILCLFSPDFVADDRCAELTLRALRRNQARQAALLGILIRDCTWQDTPLGHLQMLPRSEKDLTSTTNRDAWWKEVTAEILTVIRAREEDQLKPLWSQVQQHPMSPRP